MAQFTPGPWESIARQLQYEANLRAANARDHRFSRMHRAAMQREAAVLYARARAAIARATGQIETSTLEI